MGEKQLFAKINLVDYTRFMARTFWSGSEDPLREFLRTEGAEAFSYEHPGFFGRVQGWIEVPEGACVVLNL